MASKLLNATSEYQDSRGQWFTGHDPLITKPGATNTYKACVIIVPFAHRLLKAVFAAADLDEAGVMSVILKQADDGDATAGATVTSQNLADSSGTVDITELVLGAVAGQATTGARAYWLLLQGTAGGDLIHRPQLAILIEPVTRSTL